MKKIKNAYPVFVDRNGDPLNDGYVYIGTAGLNPISNQITAYWDAALTVPATQPVRTKKGYAVYGNGLGQLYVSGDYSIVVRDRNLKTVYANLDVKDAHIGDQSLLTTDDVVFNQVTADLVGDVTGNVTGNVTGDVTGNADTADLAASIADQGSGAETLNVKVIQIGDWNMDATGTVDVAHGIASGMSKIRMVTAVIRNDDDSQRYLINQWDAIAAKSGGGVGVLSDTNIRLMRLTGGDFDATDFDATSYNRGWITVWYTD